jgi:hypothetical protein
MALPGSKSTSGAKNRVGIWEFPSGRSSTPVRIGKARSQLTHTQMCGGGQPRHRGLSIDGQRDVGRAGGLDALRRLG